MSTARRLFIAVCFIVLVAALVGCAPATPPDEVAQSFVRAVLQGDAAAASAVASESLNQDDLRDFRQQMTGESIERHNANVRLFPGAVDNDSALFDVVSVQAVPAPDPREVNERGFSVALDKRDSRWVVRIDPADLQ